MIGRTASRYLLIQYGSQHARYSTKTTQQIGIIGLGNVGSTVAKNLLKSGFTVSALLDKNPEVGRDLPGDIPRPNTPRELASMSDVVMTALPAPPHVKQVLTGEDGVLAGLRSGGVWIDHSTTDYQQTLELAEKAGIYIQKWDEYFYSIIKRDLKYVRLYINAVHTSKVFWKLLVRVCAFLS